MSFPSQGSRQEGSESSGDDLAGCPASKQTEDFERELRRLKRRYDIIWYNVMHYIIT